MWAYVLGSIAFHFGDSIIHLATPLVLMLSCWATLARTSRNKKTMAEKKKQRKGNAMENDE